ncbi:MAG TPA: NAD-binding protein [Spirochaetia bacterium]|nr:NAD-binding protein [Spirochaetia bacterium]
MYIIIVGGGKVGYYLTRTVLDEGHEATLIEFDSAKAAKLTEEFGEIVLNGDGSRIRVLEEAGCARADVVVAVTGEDEDNLIISQLASQKFKVKRVIARVNNPRNQHIFSVLGVASTVSSTSVIARMIEREVTTQEMHTILSFERGDLDLVEIDLKPASPAVKKHVKEISLPEGCLLVTVIRGDKVIVPKGQTTLREGDRVLALTPQTKYAELKKTLLGDRG